MPTIQCRVLVVDDDQDTAQSLAYLLVQMGHEATFLTDPGQAVDAAQRMRPHIVFLDIGMPGMNGWEVARILRKHYPLDGALRLVAISGRGDDDARAKSRHAGFDAHVVKPIELDLVEVIIRQLGPARER